MTGNLCRRHTVRTGAIADRRAAANPATAHDSTAARPGKRRCIRIARAALPHRLEHRPDLELKVLYPVTDLLVHRVAITEFERSDRRVPRDARADRITERFELRLRAVVIDLACIGEYRQPNR